MMKTMKKIVVHAGQAHLDDYMACAIALAARAMATPNATVTDILVPIERRDPTPEELEDPDILVLDVGGKFEPEKGDYDHHQFERGTKKSAMGLLAADLAFDDCSTMFDFLTAVYPWFETRIVLDACGPFAAAKEAGTSWDVVEKFLGPFEDIVLKEFSDCVDPLDRAQVVAPLAQDIIARMDAWDKVAPLVNCPVVDGVEVVDFTAADPAMVDAVSDAMTRTRTGVALFHDNRGPGLTLLRLKDDPRIDFSRVKDDPRVAFAHPGGFVAKTRGKGVDDALALVKAALVPSRP